MAHSPIMGESCLKCDERWMTSSFIYVERVAVCHGAIPGSYQYKCYAKVGS